MAKPGKLKRAITTIVHQLKLNFTCSHRRKDELKPQITLDHLVKERYPRFIDALRDLDDALCMVHLFASMPSTGRITADRTANCARLVKQWQHYIAKSRTLHKVFVSVKGVYFQAEIMAEPVTWIVPHQFTQAVPKEVDVRVMLTFLEFYEVFLQFVMFKLYSAQNMQYPPKVDQALEAEGCFLAALKSDRLESAPADAATEATLAAPDATSSKSAKAKAVLNKTSAETLSTLPKLLKELGNQEEEDDEELEEIGQLTAPLSEALAVRADDSDDDETEQRVFATQSTDPLKRLFANLVFFVNREVPLEWMQLCTLSFGAKVAWDGPLSPYAVDDARITHHIVDRPQMGVQATSREYVQPQWVFDCINAQVLLPVHNYRPGCKLPPHLSPFVDDDKEGYMPKYRAEIRKLQAQMGGNAAASNALVSAAEQGDDDEEESEGEQDEEVQEARGAKRKSAAVATTPSSSSAANKKQKKAPVPEPEEESEQDDEGSGSDDGEDEDEEAEQQKVLKAYTGKDAAKKGPKGVVFKPHQEEVTEVRIYSFAEYMYVCCVYFYVRVFFFRSKGNPGSRNRLIRGTAKCLYELATSRGC